MMSSKPTHTAFLAQEYEQAGEKKTMWHRVGSVWPHNTGNGMTLVITPGMAVSGKVVIMPVKDDEAPINF
jgi:hypothetical protein